jgi:hypothetical protein
MRFLVFPEERIVVSENSADYRKHLNSPYESKEKERERKVGEGGKGHGRTSLDTVQRVGFGL